MIRKPPLAREAFERAPRGLLLAGVVIGALGVLDEVTVTQTSAIWELRRANPSLGWRELYGAGLRIGRDHVGSAINTLAMAYAGAALPVLLYTSLSGVGLGAILSSEESRRKSCGHWQAGSASSQPSQ